jgi:hypothetical protein
LLDTSGCLPKPQTEHKFLAACKTGALESFLLSGLHGADQ